MRSRGEADAGGEGEPVLEVDVAHRRSGFELEARFASSGRVTALFGRSGAGKTTLVNLLAGLVRPARGRIAARGRVLVDTERRLFLPAHRRRVGYVFQEGRLFPHLTVRQNLLYGRWFAGAARRFGSLAETVELLGIEHLLQRRPANLSGGEKQRVAIGRALLASPDLLLMDEPLASLDAERKREILPFIERLCRELLVPIVYVTHNAEEVVRLADTVVLLAAGRVAAVGETAELLSRVDLGRALDGEGAGAVLTGTVLDDAGGLVRVGHPAGELFLPIGAVEPGRRLRLRVRARDVVLAVGPLGELSIRNRLRAQVVDITAAGGPLVDVELAVADDRLIARITTAAAAELALAPGMDVTALVKAAALEL